MKYLITFTFFLVLIQKGFPQDSAWYYVPFPKVYNISSMVSQKDSSLFVSTSSGLFVTNDNCETWEQLSKADSACPWMFDIVINRQNYIIGSTHDDRICISTNMGQSWQVKNVGMTFSNLAIDSSGTIWGVAPALYKSTDNGRNWEMFDIGDNYFSDVVISKQNDIYLCAGKFLYLSADNGLTWQKIGLPNYIYGFTVNDDGELFGSIYNSGFCSSKDKGKTWVFISSSPVCFSKLISDKRGNLFYIWGSNVFISSDSAKSWEFIGGNTPVLITHKGDLYAAGEEISRYNYNYIPEPQPKIKFPLNRGNAWQYISFGAFNSVTGSGSSSSGIETVYVLDDTAINNNTYYKLSDFPKAWIRYSETDNKIYTFYNGKDAVQTDFTSIAGAPVTQLQLDSNTPWNAVVSRGIDTVLGVLSDFLTLTGGDGGAMSVMRKKYNSGLGYTYFSSSSYYTGTGGSYYGLRLIQAIINENGQVKNYSYPYYPQIVITPPKTINDSSLLFSFKVMHNYNTLMSSGKSLIYIDSVYLSGFYKKDNSVIGDVKIKAENLEQTYIYMVDTSLSLDLLKQGYSFYFKVYARDKGIIPRTAIEPDTGYFCVAYTPPNSVKSGNTDLYSFEVEQNYPNPANPSSIINYSVASECRVKITLYNSLGQMISVLEDSEKAPGKYKAAFNGSMLSSGVYFYHISAGKYAATKKLILMK
jgi:hypothetical protein